MRMRMWMVAWVLAVALVGNTPSASAQQNGELTEAEQGVIDALQEDLRAFWRGDDVRSVDGPFTREGELEAFRAHPLFRCLDCAGYFWNRILAALQNLPGLRFVGFSVSLGITGPEFEFHWERI